GGGDAHVVSLRRDVAHLEDDGGAVARAGSRPRRIGGGGVSDATGGDHRPRPGGRLAGSRDASSSGSRGEAHRGNGVDRRGRAPSPFALLVLGQIGTGSLGDVRPT